MLLSDLYSYSVSSFETPFIMSATKPVQDHDFFENADNNFHQDLHPSQLTPEELETEKHLRRRIDSRIMPLVILVYLMNYMFVLELTTSSQMLTRIEKRSKQLCIGTTPRLGKRPTSSR